MRSSSGMKLLAASLALFAAACSATTTRSAAPPPSGASQHSADWFTVGAGRSDFKRTVEEFDRVSADCANACKALASLQRAADHLCAVAEPEECSDARVRVDRARRAVESQCGGC